MAQAVDFKGKNRTLLPPPGAENVAAIPAFNNGICTVTCWELSEEEIAEIIRTKQVFLAVMYGHTTPPVFLGSRDAVREVVADYGVW